jgi:hypothetical protein
MILVVSRHILDPAFAGFPTNALDMFLYYAVNEGTGVSVTKG